MKMSDEERKEKKRLYNKKYRERNAEVIKKKRDEKREEQIAYLKKWRKENKDNYIIYLKIEYLILLFQYLHYL